MTNPFVSGSTMLLSFAWPRMSLSARPCIPPVCPTSMIFLDKSSLGVDRIDLPFPLRPSLTIYAQGGCHTNDAGRLSIDSRRFALRESTIIMESQANPSFIQRRMAFKLSAALTYMFYVMLLSAPGLLLIIY